MIYPSPSFVMSDYRKYIVWLITTAIVAIVAFGFRFAKGIIPFVLDKLYQFFIQNNVSSFVTM